MFTCQRQRVWLGHFSTEHMDLIGTCKQIRSKIYSHTLSTFGGESIESSCGQLNVGLEMEEILTNETGENDTGSLVAVFHPLLTKINYSKLQ